MDKIYGPTKIRSHPGASVEDKLVSELRQLYKQYSERLSKPVHVLDTVKSEIYGQLQQRLQQAKVDYQGERIALIPYLWNGQHWIGLLLKFDTSGLIEHAKLFDPVVDSTFHIQTLQARIDQCYPGMVLQTGDSLKHKDPQGSANLMIENFLDAVKNMEEHIVKVKSDPSIDSSQTVSGTKSTVSRCFTLESYDELLSALRSGFEKRDIRNKEELSDDLREKRAEIEKLERKEKHHLAHRRKHSLKELEELWSLVEQKELLDLMKPEKLNGRSPESEISSESTEEILNNLSDDLHRMPSCSERSVRNLLFYIFLRSRGIRVAGNSRFTVPDDLGTQMKKEIDSLGEALKREDLLSAENETLWETLSTYVKHEYWKSAIELLNKLKLGISPLDIRELFRLVERVDDAARTIKGKDIILVLGGTGAGKSTAIHFLAGSRFVEEMVGGLKHLTPTNVRHPQLTKVVTAPSARAQTRYMTAISISPKDIGGYSNDIITLCDSPGFDDTSGAEVDIANGIGIVRAVQGCKHVKPVVLISYKSMGDRCSGIKDLARTLVSLIPDIGDHLRSFSYIFTKFPSEERSTIAATLKDLYDRLSDEEKLDANYKALLEDVYNKARTHALVLDPLKDDPREVLHELTTSTKISHPDEVFKFFISTRSKAILQEQVHKDHQCILKSIQHFDYALAEYKFDQLKLLNDLVHQPHIEKSYETCVAHVSDHLKKQYETAVETLDRYFANSLILSEEDLQMYQRSSNQSEAAESLRAKHLSQTDTFHCSAFQSYLDKQLELFCERLGTKDFDDSSVTPGLNRIQLVAKYFSNHTKAYEHIQFVLKEKVEYIVTAFKASVNLRTLEDTAMHLTQVHAAMSTLHSHLDPQYLNTTYMQMREYVLTYLQAIVDHLNGIFKTESLNETEVETINANMSLIDRAANLHTLQTHLSKESITSIHEQCLLTMTNYFQNIFNQFNAALERRDSLNSLERYMKKLVRIRCIPAIESKLSQSYWQAVEQLVGQLRMTVGNIEMLLENLKTPREDFTYRKLIEEILNLQKMKWIETYRPGVYTVLENSIHTQTIQCVIDVKKSVLSTSLDLDHYERIEPTYKRVASINEFKKLETIIFGIYSEHCHPVNDWFLTVLTDQVNMIRKNFSVEQWTEKAFQGINFGAMEKSFNYLDRCQRVPLLLDGRCRSVLRDLREFVRCFSYYIQKEMEKSLEAIIRNQNRTDEDISPHTRLLENRLEEISRIQEQYPMVFSHFANRKISEHWKTELSECLLRLSDEMEESIRFQRGDAVEDQLFIAKTLSRLDKFLTDGKFIDAHRKYQNSFYNQLKAIQEAVIQEIQNNQYELVPLQIEFLVSSKDFGEYFVQLVKRALKSRIQNLIEQTENEALFLDDAMETEKVRSIVEKVKLLQRGKQFTSQILSKSEEIDACITVVKKRLSERMHRFMKSIEAVISVNNFDSAEKKIQYLTSICHLTDLLCDPELSQQINAVRHERLFTRLKILVARYSDMDLSEYGLHPPVDILVQLSQVGDIDPIYIQTHKELMEIIVMKCRGVLEEARATQIPSEKNLRIRKFESAIKYLPKAMQESFGIELEHCKNDIQLKIQQPEERLIQECKDGNTQNIKTILKDYQGSDELQPYFRRGKEFVARHIRDDIAETKRLFDQNEFAQALNKVEKLNQYRLDLRSVLPDLEALYDEVKKQMSNLFDEAYRCFIAEHLENRSRVAGEEVDKAILTSFLCLSTFLKYSDSNQDKIGLSDFLSNTLDEKIRLLQENIASHLSKVQQNYHQALQNMDISRLKTVLDIARRWHPFFSIMKTERSTDLFIRSAVTLTPFSEMLESIVHRLRVHHDSIIRQELITDQTKQSSEQRDQVYRNLNEKIILLNRAGIFQDVDHLECNLKKLEHECVTSLEKKIDRLVCDANGILEKMAQDVPLTQADYDRFMLYFDSMKSCEKELTVIKSSIPLKIQSMEEKVRVTIVDWKIALDQTTNATSIVKILIKMKEASEYLPPFRCFIEEKMHEVLDQFRSSKLRFKDFEKLIVLLSEDKTGIGHTILEEDSVVRAHFVSFFNRKARAYGIDYILQNVEGDLLEKSKLRQCYEQYRSIYDGLIQQYLRPIRELQPLISDARSIASDIKRQGNQMRRNFDVVRNQSIGLFAHICALWTLQDAHRFSETVDIDSEDSSILQPQAAQVIAIFRMVGIGDEKEGLSNNRIQIGSGEGKSIVLGVTACFFALIGFDVHCTCFSEHLSKRDFQWFLPLFTSLGVLENVHYGGFNHLCECIINGQQNVRSAVEQLISRDSLERSTKKSSNSSKLLLVDEVDTLFHRSMYGDVYTPSIYMRDSTILALIDYIWTQRKSSSLTVASIYDTHQYRNCCIKFLEWKALIDEAIKDILADVISFAHHEYVVRDDRIGYYRYDSILFNIVDGYKTLFAYYFEHEKGSISRSSLEKNSGIIVKCGQYSYAEIPLLFESIMGVSGTALALSESEKATLKDIYKFEKQTKMPCLFGQSNLRFRKKEDVRVENGADYHSAIRREIDDRLRQNTDERAVLVFFESEKALKEFDASNVLDSIRASVSILSEQVCAVEREKIIKRAANSGRVTLLTRAFSRGIDIKCVDRTVISIGGVHVIQTFFSEDTSEEIQIQSRTARYGSDGSYSMILLDTDLEKFRIERVDIDNVRNGKPIPILSMKSARASRLTRRYETIYDFFNERRKLFCNTQHEAIIEKLEQVRRSHKISQKFLSSIQSDDVNAAKEFLIEENKESSKASESRISYIIDH